MYENDQEYTKKGEGSCSKTRSTHNEIQLSLILNEENVIIDIFLKEAHLYDKLKNHFNIFSQKTFDIYMFFSKNAK